MSGNSLFFVVFALAAIIACTPQKGARSGTSDAASKDRVYNPKTGEYELVDDAAALVDTVKWQPKADAAPPIGPVKEITSVKKDVYSVAMLMPFNAASVSVSGRFSSKTRRFLNYYSGAKMAIEDLAQAGVNLDVQVLDTKESADRVREQLDEIAAVDVIIGPYDRNSLQEAARFAAENQVPVVSPWTPAIEPAVPSEYFVQITPGLKTHAEAAMRFASERYADAKYFLVANPETKDETRMDIYSEAYQRFLSANQPIEKLVVDDVAMMPDSNALTQVYVPDITNVFVMPYYLRSEEEFVNAFLRKIHAEHGETEVVVIGLPQWRQFTGISPNYLEGLNTHITTVQYVDKSRPEVREFYRRYLETYGAIPEQSAWQAYELVSYVGLQLKEHGTGFVDASLGAALREIELRVVFSDGSHTGETTEQVGFIENAALAILIFRDQQFMRLE